MVVMVTVPSGCQALACLVPRSHQPCPFTDGAMETGRARSHGQRLDSQALEPAVLLVQRPRRPHRSPHAVSRPSALRCGPRVAVVVCCGVRDTQSPPVTTLQICVKLA